MTAPWEGGDDIPLETDDEYHSRSGMRVLELDKDSGPPLKTAAEARRRPSGGVERPRGRLQPLFALLLLGLIGWEAGAGVLQKQAAAKETDWAAAAAELRKLRKKGEPILIAPLWAEPVGRAQLAGMLNLELATLSDVDRFSRIYELSIRGARHPWLKALTPTTTRRHGAVTLAIYKQEPKTVLYDFGEQLSTATVSTAPPHQPCLFSGKRFNCGGRGQWVGRYLAEVDHRPYRCIYAPPAAGRRLRIEYPAVPIGTKIVLYSGIDDFENRKKAKGAVRLQVFVDEKLVGGVLHQNDWPWYRVEADTKTLDGKRLPIRFEITSDRALFRSFCFHAEARR